MAGYKKLRNNLNSAIAYNNELTIKKYCNKIIAKFEKKIRVRKSNYISVKWVLLNNKALTTLIEEQWKRPKKQLI